MENTNKTNTNVTANEELKKVKEQLKVELGLHDFNEAEVFWKQFRRRKLTAEDYMVLKEVWTNVKFLKNCWLHDEEDSKLVTYALFMRYIMVPEGVKVTDVNSWSRDELIFFIQEQLNRFDELRATEILTKDTVKILKMDLSVITINDNNVAQFDSNNASVYTGAGTVVKDDSMRYIETSEDGISRMLAEKGLDIINICFAESSTDEDRQAEIMSKKRHIFENGVQDIATGKHYRFAFQNASMNRKAICMFVESESWDDIFEHWYELTGCHDAEGFHKMFGHEMILSKVLVRISSRGSNSFDLNKLEPNWLDGENLGIKYIEDVTFEYEHPWKQIVGPNKMEMKTGVRTATSADGEGLMSETVAAKFSHKLKIISTQEYEEFTYLWNACGKTLRNVKTGSRLAKLISKIPQVFQIRRGSWKGILVVADIEYVPELQKDNIHFIIPNSVRKYMDNPEFSDYPLEVCQYLKKKKDWVNLNAQFIGALDFSNNPNALNKIADFHINNAIKSLKDIGYAQAFHNIFNKSASEEDTSVLTKILSSSAYLIDDYYTLKLRRDQYVKLFKDLKTGRLPVPGMYSYMICDPYWVLLNAPELKDMSFNFTADEVLQSGEYYHNNKDCKCGLFRSPLIHPFEAQRVQLCKKDIYWYLKDVIVFNSEDALWERLGGADFDGDTCAIIPDDTEFGKMIVDAIRVYDYDVWEPALNADKVFVDLRPESRNLDNLFDYLTRTSKVDETGIITNYAMRSLDIANHFNDSISIAKVNGCSTITMVHPKDLPNNGVRYQPQICVYPDGHKSLSMKGFVKMVYNKETHSIMYSESKYHGEFTFDETKAFEHEFLNLVEYDRPLQGREIDSAKTGVGAAGKNGDEYTDEVRTIFSPQWLVSRQLLKNGEELTEMYASSKLNDFISLSPLSRLHDYVFTREHEVMDFVDEGGSNKLALLQSLLTQQEMNKLNMIIPLSDGRQISVLEYLKERKSAYNTDIANIMKMKTSDEEESKEKNIGISKVKEREITLLEQLSGIIGASMEVLSAGCYIASYQKTSNLKNGLSYGWILTEELLNVFARGNQKHELYALPNNAKEAYVQSGVLYVNGYKYRNIKNAQDGDVAIQRFGKSRLYAMIYQREFAEDTRRYVTTYSNQVYTLGVIGFRFHDSKTVTEWHRLVCENGCKFDIKLDEKNGSLITYIEGKGTSLSAVTADTSYDLVGKTVQVVNPANNPIKMTQGAIMNIQVMIVGEAQ